jgi:hypothetical protein
VANKQLIEEMVRNIKKEFISMLEIKWMDFKVDDTAC